MPQKIIILGGGFSSLSAACFLAQSGFEVKILEKNNYLGGRARQLKKDDFLFDMGPTFYWMPDVFEDFFKSFGHSASDFYELEKLDPAYQVFFQDGEPIKIGDNLDKITATFESIEAGSGQMLKQFIKNAEENYTLAINDLVYKPGQNIFEIMSLETIQRLNLFIQTIKNQVSKYVKNPKLQKILEFPVLFLGAKSSDTPAFYNFMNYADFGLGTWHPKGGMYKVIEGIVQLAKKLGVEYELNSEVTHFDFNKNKITAVHSNSASYNCDVVLSGADYAHTEKLLPKNFRQYSQQYWDKKKFAPSALLFYVAFNKKLKNIEHHTLFFDSDFETHERAIYDTIEYPENPLFYASFPSKTDTTFAPEGKEAATFLIPLAPGLEDKAEMREKYFNNIIERLELKTNQKLKDDILFSESFGIKDFIADYNSFKGNAYGLANTLLQTHILRPKLKSKKLDNLYFTGQLTVPGPGVPPSLISGNIVSKLIIKNHL